MNPKHKILYYSFYIFLLLLTVTRFLPDDVPDPHRDIQIESR